MTRHEACGPAAPSAFGHEAFLYAGRHEFLNGTVPFIEAGLKNDEVILVMAGSEKIALLRQELGGDQDRVCFADMARIGTNPARIIPTWQEFLAGHPDHVPARGIVEPIWSGRTPAELEEYQRHEILLNVAFAGTTDFRMLCPYDTESLDSRILDQACRSHPRVHGGPSLWPAGQGIGPDALHRFDAPLPEPEPSARPAVFRFAAGQLAEVRRFVSRHLSDQGLGRERIDDALLVVNEIAANSLRHGGGSGVLSLWQEDGRIIFQIEDQGSLDDPLAGRTRPVVAQVGGYGLWLVNQLCDLVQIRRLPTGSVVRMHFRNNADSPGPALGLPSA